MKKLITALLISFILFSFGVSVSAEEIDGSAVSVTEEGCGEEIPIATDEATDAAVPESSEATDVAVSASIEESEDGTSIVFDAILDNISEILSVLTFAISIILTLLYKKGLMPTLGGALGSIDDTVKSFGEKAESKIASAEEAVRRIDGRIENMGGIIESVSTTLCEIDKRIFELEEKRSDGDSIRVLMKSQVEELWEIFSSSELSEISKKTLEEKLTVIREHLNTDKQ